MAGVSSTMQAIKWWPRWIFSTRLQPIPETLPLDVRHHEVEEAVGFPGVVQRQDMRMLQIRRCLDLG
jgi:hypothetical protein